MLNLLLFENIFYFPHICNICFQMIAQNKKISRAVLDIFLSPCSNLSYDSSLEFLSIQVFFEILELLAVENSNL